MRFVRLFGSGLNTKSADVRDKIFAEFSCSICGKTSEIDVTSTRQTFDFNRERKCPHCKMLNEKDKALNLQASIERLTQEKSKIEIQIEQLIKALDELKEQSNVINY